MKKNKILFKCINPNCKQNVIKKNSLCDNCLVISAASVAIKIGDKGKVERFCDYLMAKTINSVLWFIRKYERK
jgi:hypothetical protein